MSAHERSRRRSRDRRLFVEATVSAVATSVGTVIALAAGSVSIAARFGDAHLLQLLGVIGAGGAFGAAIYALVGSRRSARIMEEAELRQQLAQLRGEQARLEVERARLEQEQARLEASLRDHRRDTSLHDDVEAF